MPSLTQKLREEYRQLFTTCTIRSARVQEVETLVSRIEQSRNRYTAVGDATAIPWYFIGVIHCLEASLNFTKHLHNGDPLTARTVQVPKGRPPTGNPPFTWEESAIDALTFEKLHQWTDWSIPGTLFKLELYNGWGYRNQHPEVLSPYLWGFSFHYARGKFVADGQWSPTAVSGQCGGAVLLRRMAERGIAQFPAEPGAADIETLGAVVRYAPNEVSERVKELQRFLNTFPGIFLRVDGRAGDRTSDAFKIVTGHFLQGDPRAG